MDQAATKKFTVFRSADTLDLDAAGIMDMVMPATVPDEVGQCIAAGYQDGAWSRVIFSGFGLSVVHVWFKRAFPLPLHSHDADCVYYIIGGSLRLGTESLGTGDGFFVPADVPYTYTPGADGVELIEIRNKDRFDYREKSSGAFWRKALRTVEDNKEAWAGARRLISVDA